MASCCRGSGGSERSWALTAAAIYGLAWKKGIANDSRVYVGACVRCDRRCFSLREWRLLEFPHGIAVIVAVVIVAVVEL